MSLAALAAEADASTAEVRGLLEEGRGESDLSSSATPSRPRRRITRWAAVLASSVAGGALILVHRSRGTSRDGGEFRASFGGASVLTSDASGGSGASAGDVDASGSDATADKSSGQLCWAACQKSGFCDWCGEHMACCRADPYLQTGEHEPPPECSGVGGVGKHECTPAVESQGQRCGSIDDGSGTPKWHNCGTGLVCDGKVCVKDPAADAETAISTPEPGGAAKSVQSTAGVQPSLCTGARTGTCRFLACNAAEGPTQCVDGACLCAPGFCAVNGVCERVATTTPMPTAHMGDACFPANKDALPCRFGLTCDNATASCVPDLSIGVELGFGASLPPREPELTPSEEVPPGVINWGSDCWPACGRGGFCAFCGAGNACCRSGLEKPLECSGVTLFGALGHHTCVKPVLDVTTTTTTIPPSVLNWGQDCWPACGGGGLCDWCGKGMACCRKGWRTPHACADVTQFGTWGRHTCVAPVSHHAVSPTAAHPAAESPVISRKPAEVPSASVQSAAASHASDSAKQTVVSGGNIAQAKDAMQGRGADAEAYVSDVNKTASSNA
eukprot:TRINITY_DN11678_c0_g3_i1.p1 TRINITY_DN11678_c0_g3~~TRINITY_DN11678_c0_g3_i1.p1  ORF type:complete len:572 (+),score=55.65 TRINITY_DN11678_c0_g3_i1:44-1717(+)